MSLNVPSSSASVVARVSSPATVKQNPMKRKRDDEIIAVVPMDMHKEPSWEILCLLGAYMDPESLSLASCVSTTWLSCFSSEKLWKYVLTARSARDPSSNLAIATETMERFSYKRLVSIDEAEAKRQRKNQPEEPKISLSDLLFIFHVSIGSSTIASVYKKGKELEFGSNDRFQIEVDLKDSAITADAKDVRLKWQVVYRDWKKMLTLVDITRSLDAKYGWFTDELPVKERCFPGGSKLKGDVKPSFNGESVLEKIGFAIVDSSDWGSLSANDVLRNLQRFFVE